MWKIEMRKIAEWTHLKNIRMQTGCSMFSWAAKERTKIYFTRLKTKCAPSFPWNWRLTLTEKHLSFYLSLDLNRNYVCCPAYSSDQKDIMRTMSPLWKIWKINVQRVIWFSFAFVLLSKSETLRFIHFRWSRQL